MRHHGGCKQLYVASGVDQKKGKDQQNKRHIHEAYYKTLKY